MSKRRLEGFGSVVCHEECDGHHPEGIGAIRDGLIFAGSVAHVKVEWFALGGGGNVYLQSNGMTDATHRNFFIVLRPDEARVLGTMLIEAGDKTDPKR